MNLSLSAPSPTVSFISWSLLQSHCSQHASLLLWEALRQPTSQELFQKWSPCCVLQNRQQELRSVRNSSHILISLLNHLKQIGFGPFPTIHPIYSCLNWISQSIACPSQEDKSANIRKCCFGFLVFSSSSNLYTHCNTCTCIYMYLNITTPCCAHTYRDYIILLLKFIFL